MGWLLQFRIVGWEDKEIVAAARRVLTASWVDLTQVSIRATRGVVHVAGHLQRMTVSHNEFTHGGLREIDLRLRAIRDVRDVKYRLDNWRRNVDGGWLATPDGENATFVVDELLADGS